MCYFIIDRQPNIEYNKSCYIICFAETWSEKDA